MLHNISDQQGIQLQWDKQLKSVLIQKKEAVDSNVNGLIEIAGVRADRNWWYPTSQIEQDLESVKIIFDNFNHIVFHGNSVLGNVTECSDKLEL